MLRTTEMRRFGGANLKSKVQIDGKRNGFSNSNKIRTNKSSRCGFGYATVSYVESVLGFTSFAVFRLV